jgi:tetratricopeptide (TPR) repeat protein
MVSILIVAATAFAVENPNVGDPLRRSSSPTQSGQQQRFITQPGTNPYGQTGNDIVSGNVGGGRHFRGIVPYGSSYYSGAYSNSLGSRSVSNFMRRSADPLVNDRNPGRTETYYDPRRTVTSLQRPDSDSGLTKPQMTGQGRANPYKITAPTQDLKVQPIKRPITANDMELEKILSRQEEIRQEALDKAEQQDEESEAIKRSFFDPIPQLEPETEQEQADTEQEMTPEQQRAAEIDKEIQEALIEQKSIRTREDQVDADMQKQEDEDEPVDWMSPKSKHVPDLDSETIDRDKGREVLGEHETFASLADEKFDNYMLLAETHLKKGQFYKAADIFALANVWKPKDARAFLGQSFSLFFAGEYMSCAYYLSRAIELDPDLALKKYDLTDLAANRDAFENSSLEVMAAQKQSYSPELAFLVSYVAYQEGKAEQAVRLINVAKEAMPDSRAVSLLKNIIDPDLDLSLE